VEYLNGASLRQAPALPPNIRLIWKGLLGTNTLTYYQNLLITAELFFTSAPGKIMSAQR
jgi:hypothetical protein